MKLNWKAVMVLITGVEFLICAILGNLLTVLISTLGYSITEYTTLNLTIAPFIVCLIWSLYKFINATNYLLCVCDENGIKTKLHMED